MKHIILFLVTLSFLPAYGIEISRDIPQFYTKHLKQHLSTDLPKPALDAKYIHKNDDTLCLLKENITYVGPDGKSQKAIRYIYQALSKKGAQNLRERYFSYTHTQQNIFLVKAFTRQKNGEIQKVKKDAAFIKVGTEDSEDLYDDESELTIVFPRVKIGSIVEYTVALQENVIITPGEYKRSISFDRYDPAAKVRYIIDIEKQMADRLNIFNLGNVPSGTIKKIPNERVLLTWQKENIPALPWESGSTPFWQKGPFIKLTTWNSWQDFHNWYYPLLDERSQLSPELTKQVEQWTKGIDNPAEIAEILLRKVADDIRYTGLEFGLGGYQPHDCNEVWENHYGDCKDKSNLLRVMLAVKGIKSYICLLNTKHKGKFFKESPSYGYFNHAILAIELEKGKYTFCDPTIEYLKVGQVSFGDSDREVLLVKDDKVEFTYIPDQRQGKIHYDFDLTYKLDGDISGWLNLQTTGYWDAIYSDFYWKRNDRDRRESVESVIAAFFPEAKLIDLEMTEKGKKENYSYKAYFIIKGAKLKEQLSLSVKDGGYIFPSFDEKERNMNLYRRYEDDSATIKITLPAEYSIHNLPAKLNMNNDVYSLLCQWTQKEQSYKADLKFKSKKRSIAPQEFQKLNNSLNAVKIWMSEPLIAFKSVDQNNTPLPKETVAYLQDFPRLSSAKSQLKLIDEKYPESGNIDLRIAALLKTISWFPQEKHQLFEAHIILGNAYLEAEKVDQAHKSVTFALKAYKEHVDRHYFAWGEYCLGLVLVDQDKTEKAVEIFDRLATNKELSDFRRGWSYYKAADYVEGRDNSINYLKEAIKINGETFDRNFRFLINQLCRNGNPQEVSSFLKKLDQQKIEERHAIINNLATYPEWYLENSEVEAAIHMHSELEKYIDQKDKGYAKAIASLKKAYSVLADIRRKHAIYKILKKIDKVDFPWWDQLNIDMPDKYEDYAKLANSFLEKQQYRSYVKVMLHAIIDFKFDHKTFTKELWQPLDALKEIKNLKKFKEINKLSFYCKRLPKKDPYFKETYFTLAERELFLKNPAKAIKIYEEVLSKSPHASWRLEALSKLAKANELAENFNQALTVYQKIAKEYSKTDKAEVGSLLFRAMCINLELKKDKEALRLATWLTKLPKEVIQKTEMPQYIYDLQSLLKTNKAEQYWQAARKNFQAWETLRPKFKKKLDSINKYVPLSKDEHITAMEDTMNDIPTFVNVYDRMMALGRWIPNKSSVTALWVSRLAATFPKFEKEMYDANLALMNNLVYHPEGDIPTYYIRKLILEVDANYNERATKSALEYYDRFTKQDEFMRAVYRLHAMASTREGHEIQLARKKFEELFQTEIRESDHLQNVQTLGEIYDYLNLKEEKLALYNKHVDLLEEDNDNKYHKLIIEDYHKEKDLLYKTQRLKDALTLILNNYKPAWYDHISPMSLTEDKYTDLKNYLKNTPSLTKANKFKIHSLVINHPRYTLEDKQESLEYILDDIAENFVYTKDMATYIDFILNSPFFTDDEKSYVIYTACIESYFNVDRKHFKKYTEHQSLVENNYQSQWLLGSEKYLQSLTSIANTEAYLESFIGKKVIHDDTYRIIDALNFLAKKSKPENFNKWLKKAQSLKLDLNDEDNDSHEFKLELFRVKKDQQNYAHIYNYMQKISLQNITKLSEPNEQLTKPEYMMFLNKQDCISETLRFFRDNMYIIGSIRLWLKILESDSSKISKEKVCDAVLTCIKQLKNNNDLSRAKIFKDILLAYNPEDEYARKVIEAMKSLSKPQDFPESSSIAKLYEFRTLIQRDVAPDFKAFFKNTEGKFFNESRPRRELVYYLTLANHSQLHRTLNGMTDDEMLDWQTGFATIPALKELQRTEELQIVSDKLAKECTQKLNNAWYEKDSKAMLPVIKMLKILEAEIPGHLELAVKDFLQMTKDPEQTFKLKINYMELTKDWQGILELCSHYKEKNPSTDIFRIQGLAALHMQDKHTAKTAFENYLAKEKLSAYVPVVKALLQKIK
ncbi:MAG: DUF3857 domain-containing protein [Lentisphaerales bacterium]|nr:DUF3857 domain-containing protein [Lentisphaerales bacterium]